jgi:hypothetical protein
MNPIIQSPKVFISYAWDTVDSNAWVKKLATDLRNQGIDVHLDQWKLVPGDRMALFMEKSVKENNYVLIICTPKYKYKSENRIGGVGYEGDIMTAEVLQDANPRKFIPIIQTGDMNTAIAGWLAGKFFIDFANSLHYDNNLDSLMRTILNIRETEPPLGQIPEEYVKEITDIQAKQEEAEQENVKIGSTVIENTVIKNKQVPFLEADLIWHGGSRSPRGYSDKNPQEMDEDGRMVTIIGAGVKPIIFWELGWRFDLVIHNNSSYPAFNIQIESIGAASFSSLEKLDKVNNLKPLENIKLKAEFRDFVEGVHTVADEIIAYKIPQKLEGLVLKISYIAEDRSECVTLMKIEHNKVINIKE